jgi:hypothetical protein
VLLQNLSLVVLPYAAPIKNPKPRATANPRLIATMAGGRSQVNKAHKSRYSSKSSRHTHRTESLAGDRKFLFFSFLVPFRLPLFELLRCFVSSAKAKIVKSAGGHGAAVKGARAARIQKSKAVWYIFAILFCCYFSLKHFLLYNLVLVGA